MVSVILNFFMNNPGLQKYIAENPTKANLSCNEFLHWARE